jgi:hypothetical protein
MEMGQIVLLVLTNIKSHFSVYTEQKMDVWLVYWIFPPISLTVYNHTESDLSSDHTNNFFISVLIQK